MAILTVGTGKTFATIAAAIAASAAGDHVFVYATPGNTYVEQVSYPAFGLNIVGMVPQQGIKIQWNAVAYVVSMAINAVGLPLGLKNFTIENTAGGGGVYQSNNIAPHYLVDSCIIRQTGAAGASIGFLGSAATVAGGSYTAGRNILVDGFGTGIQPNASRGISVEHATVVNCGIGMLSGTLLCAYGCLCASNGVDYSGVSFGVHSQGNVSADLTAPGVNAVTGFNAADFVGGGDYRIKQASRISTLARMPGNPICPNDITCRRRPIREDAFYAGAYHCFEQPTWGPGELSGIA